MNSLSGEHLIALDAATGTPKWVKPLGGYLGFITEPLVLSNDVIYVSTMDGVSGFSISAGDKVISITTLALNARDRYTFCNYTSYNIVGKCLSECPIYDGSGCRCHVKRG